MWITRGGEEEEKSKAIDGSYFPPDTTYYVGIGAINYIEKRIRLSHDFAIFSERPGSVELTARQLCVGSPRWMELRWCAPAKLELSVIKFDEGRFSEVHKLGPLGIFGRPRVGVYDAGTEHKEKWLVMTAGADDEARILKLVQLDAAADDVVVIDAEYDEIGRASCRERC